MHFRERLRVGRLLHSWRPSLKTVFSAPRRKWFCRILFFWGGPAWYHKETVITTQTFSCFILPERLSFKKKKKCLRRDGKSAASVRCWSSTHVGVLFDRHKQFFLQVNDGSNRLRQLQRVFVHKAIHCVAVHVLTHSVDL